MVIDPPVNCDCLNISITIGDRIPIVYNAEAQIIDQVNGRNVFFFTIESTGYYIWFLSEPTFTGWVISTNGYDGIYPAIAFTEDYTGPCPNSLENNFTWQIGESLASAVETSNCSSEQTSCNNCDSVYVDIKTSPISTIQTVVANKIGEFNGENLYSFIVENTIYYLWVNTVGDSWNISSGGYGNDPQTYIAGIKLSSPCPDSINNGADWALYNSWQSLTTSAPCKCIKIIYSNDEGEFITIEVSALPNLFNDKFIYELPIEGIPGGPYLYFQNTWKVGNNAFQLESLSSCPYGLFSVGVSSPLQSFLVIPDCECPSNTEEEELQNCFKLLVWQKQCDFGKCVLNYLQQLQLGMTDCCELFEELKNKRRILRILNCYDTRDIPDDTMNYNCISYTEIKNLLNS